MFLTNLMNELKNSIFTIINSFFSYSTTIEIKETETTVSQLNGILKELRGKISITKLNEILAEIMEQAEGQFSDWSA
jgi:type I restriction enzyme R subunit